MIEKIEVLDQKISEMKKALEWNGVAFINGESKYLQLETCLNELLDVSSQLLEMFKELPASYGVNSFGVTSSVTNGQILKLRSNRKSKEN